MDGIALADRDKLTGKTVGSLRKDYGVIVAGLKRGDALSLLPANDVALAARDLVFAVSDLRGLNAIRAR